MLTLVLTLALSQPPDVKPLEWQPTIDIPVTAVLATGWILSEFAFKSALAPSACHWCETNSFDLQLRNLFVPNAQPSAFGLPQFDLVSNLTGFVALPLGLLGLDALLSWRDGHLRDTFLIDVTLMLEATFGALALNQATKFLAGRGRPYTTLASSQLLDERREANDHYLSFFSGHSTFSFGLAVSAATIMSLRNYRLAWVAWLVGIPLATATALLRIAADKHWATDVLLGSAIGAAFGVAVPMLFHRARNWPVTISPMSHGVMLSGRF
jgi:membrane-associated phospholipid phosphatase